MGQAIDDDKVMLFDPWKDRILDQTEFETKDGIAGC